MGRQAVNQKDLLASFEMVIAGSREEGHRAHREGEASIIAYHEVGHALVAATPEEHASP